MPQVGNSWINWGDWLNAQGGQAQAQGDALYGQVAGAAQGATDAIAGAEAGRARGSALEFTDATRRQVNDATDQLGAANAGTYGLQALFSRNNAGTGYTPGQGLYDAALTGSVKGSAFKGLRGKYRDLFGGLEAAQGRAGTALANERANPIGTGGGTSAEDDSGGGNGGSGGGGRGRLPPRTRDRVPRTVDRDQYAQPAATAPVDDDWYNRWERGI